MVCRADTQSGTKTDARQPTALIDAKTLLCALMGRVAGLFVCECQEKVVTLQQNDVMTVSYIEASKQEP